MNVQVDPRRALPAEARLRLVDCDIHPMLRSASDIRAFLAPEWHGYHDRYGNLLQQPFSDANPYPKATPALSRRDAWPANGGPPGSDLDLLRSQHLDEHDIEFGILQVLWPTAARQRNLGYAEALCRAVNDWQVADFTSKEPRLRASVMVSQEDAGAAAAEIARCARRGGYAQVMVLPRNTEPMGRRRYWPIFEAAQEHDITLGCHVGGLNGYAVAAGAGHPSFYAEEHHSNVFAMEAMVTSLIFEGVLESFPRLRFVAVEAGLAWAPSLGWRLDAVWERFRDELPAVKRPPSEYLRERFWYTTQPADEPDDPRHLREVFEWVGLDRILFASDYPHWDYDDPARALSVRLTPAERRMIFRDNAVAVYGLS